MKTIYTRNDWIQMGFKVLQTKGIDKVKVELLARKLGVSKGGFYGYFRNRDGLLQAMLDHWEEGYTKGVIANISKDQGTLGEKLRKLLYARDDDTYDATEKSLVAWASHDAKAEQVVMRVVKGRLDFIMNLFLAEGYSQDQAELRAGMVHHYMAGCKFYRTLCKPSGSDERHNELDSFILLVCTPTP